MDAHGLSEQEALARLEAEGPNLLPASAPASAARVLRGVLSEPMLLLLLGAGTIYLLLGDRREALTMLSFVVLAIAISFLEARKTERALEALRDLSAPRALVVRDGQERRIPGREVVRGDLVVLHEGDRVPADAFLLQGRVEADESLFSGESIPVIKTTDGATASLHASTLITRGFGLAEVTATGGGTEVGRIGQALGALEEEATPLQRAARRVVVHVAILGTVFAVAAFLLSWLWADRGLLPSLLAGLALTMALLPQEIPMVLMVFLALGAWRLSAKRVLTRRVPMVEALGATTVMAVDKTGTLTENRMAVLELAVEGASLSVEGLQELPETFHGLVEFSILATPVDPYDSMEKALQAFGRATLRGTEHLHGPWMPERAYDLSPGLMAMTHVYRLDHPGGHLVAAKGAPEAIVDLCHMDGPGAERVHAQVEAMARKGLRVLAVAKGLWKGPGLPPSQHDFDFEFLGLMGLMDPPRPEVPAAIADCQAAGVRILMLTGDHPQTAEALARRIGLPVEGAVLQGPDLETLDDAGLMERLRTATVCARLRPDQKLRLVRLLKADGEVVAMTGDGVNDALALKAAHIGVAMGGRGTDVAREAAAIVLVDDSFASLAGAIHEGRRIYDNLGSAIRFIFAVHVPVVGLTLAPLLMRWPLPLLPVHIAVLEMLINPACSIVLEREPAAPGIMARPPRASSATPFSGAMLVRAILQGAGVLLVLVALQALSVSQGVPADHQRTRVFLPLMLASFALILSNRTRGRGPLESLRRPNAAIGWALLGVGLLILAAATLPFVQSVLAVTTPSGADLAWGAGSLLLCIAWLEVSARMERD